MASGAVGWIPEKGSIIAREVKAIGYQRVKVVKQR
jgi:hypothetical protein